MLHNKVQMLHDDKTRAITEDIQPVISQQEGLADLVDWAIGLLRRQYLVILFVAVLGVAAGIIFLGVATPIYTAQTSVYIELHRNPIDQNPGIFGNDPIEIESQIQIIKSKAIASSVIKKLQLANNLDFGPGKKNTLDFLRSLFGRAAPSPTDTRPYGADDCSVRRQSTVELVGGRVIAIKYSSPSPEQAAQIANAVADAYITDQLEAKYQANRIAINWLQERQEHLRAQAEGLNALRNCLSNKATLSRQTASRWITCRWPRLNSRVVAARTQASDVLARLNRLQAIIRLGPSDPNIGAISEINSPIATNLRQQSLNWQDVKANGQLALEKITLQSSICAIACRNSEIRCLMNCGKLLKPPKTTTMLRRSAKKKQKDN